MPITDAKHRLTEVAPRSYAGFPCGVALDASHVYWANSETGTIGRANLDGTGVDQSFITTGGFPCGVAVDAAHVYWDEEGPRTIGRANPDGTGADPRFITRARGPCGVAVDAAHIYWKQSFRDIGRANLNGTGVKRRLIPFSGGGGGQCGVAVDALRSFGFGKVKKNRKDAAAKLAVKVPGPGELETWADLTMEAEELISAGDSVLVSVRQRGVARISGVPTDAHYFTLWTFRGGKIVRIENFTERAKALEAIGLPE